jgi:hypothetical protein
MTNTSAFDLNNVQLFINLQTNEVIAQYGDIRGTYKFAEFADVNDEPLSEMPIVSLMLAVRMKFASEALTVL